MKNIVLVGLIAAGAATGASAEGFYVGGALGSANVAGVEEYVQQGQAVASSFGVSSTSEYTDRAGSLKLIGGYSVNRYFAVEVGFTNFGTQEADIRYTGLGSEHNEWDISASFIDAIGMLPLSDSFSLLGKIGYAQTRTEYTYTDTLGGYYKANKSKGVTKYGVGAEYVFAKKYAVRAEFEKYGKVGNQFDYDSDISKGSDIDVLSVGFNYKF